MDRLQVFRLGEFSRLLITVSCASLFYLFVYFFFKSKRRRIYRASIMHLFFGKREFPLLISSNRIPLFFPAPGVTARLVNKTHSVLRNRIRELITYRVSDEQTKKTKTKKPFARQWAER